LARLYTSDLIRHCLKRISGAPFWTAGCQH
jgi:hypothetical protein